MLPDPADARFTCSEDTVGESPNGCGEDESEAAVSDEHADHGGEEDRAGGGDHGPEAGVGDTLIDAEADGEGSATGDETGGGMADDDSGEETEADGDDTDGRSTERELLPVEGVDVGEIAVSGWRGWI